MDIASSEWEAERLAALRDLEILDTEPAPEFDDIVELAAEICDVPIAVISLVDEDRQWFKAIVGLDASETPRSHAFCAHAILGTETMVVPDATKDPRFVDNPLVTGDPNIRLYAGVPVLSPSDHPLGTLCLIDSQPRDLTPRQLRHLEILAGQVEQLLTLHHRNLAGKKREALLQSALEESIQARGVTRALLDNSRNLIGVLSVDGRVRDTNLTALRTSGVDPEDVIGVPFWETPWWTHSEEQQKQLQQAIQLAASGHASGFLATHPTPTGDLVEIDFRIVPIMSASGEVAYLVPEGVDITEHTQLQRSLVAAKNASEESELRFRNIADSSTLLIFTTDTTGRITWANQPLLAYSGDSLDELQQQKWSSLIHVEDAKQALQLHENADPRDYGFECRVPRYDGDNFWHLLKLSPRCTKNRQKLGYVGVLVDIDASRVGRVAFEASQASLKKALADLNKVNTELEQTAHALSHDVMPPLASLEQLTRLAETNAAKMIPPQSNALLLNIRQHTVVVKSMLEDLLGFYSVGREPEEVEDVELEQLVRDAWQGIETPDHLSLSTSGLGTVMTHRSSLATIFRNLLTNAVEHSGHSAGHILVQCDHTESMLQFRISDRGPGIAPEHHERIFDLFETAAHGASNRGSGVGLAIVRKLVEQRGGRIHVESFVNEGSTFVFTWPPKTKPCPTPIAPPCLVR